MINKKLKTIFITSMLMISIYSFADNIVNSKLIDLSEMFTNRDLDQTPNLNDATNLKLEDDKEIKITNEGIYILSGNVENTSIIIDAGDEAKVQLILQDLNITNRDMPAVYVKTADKVFITTYSGTSNLSVTGNYNQDGNTNLDAVIFSKSDIVLNGTGILKINSVKGNGISSKDDLKVTGSTILINSLKDGLEANDSIRIADGNISITTGSDALHSENEEDDTLGYIYISGGILNISAADDGIRGNSVVKIDGGTINIEKSQEGIEATQIEINDGNITIYSTDDGINATAKVSSLDVEITVNGGNINITMANGDTDAFDANGNIYINGGNINLICGSSFDADGTAQFNSGHVIINGEIVTELPSGRAGRRRH